MPLTRDEFEAACKATCPQCANGDPLRQRTETLEWVHDFYGKGTYRHSFCFASGLRKAYDQGLIEGKNG